MKPAPKGAGGLARLSQRLQPVWLACLPAFSLVAALSIAGCSQAPVVVPEIIRQPVYIPVSVTLTQPVQVALGPNPTWGSALGAYNESLQVCNGQLSAIAKLTPPTPPKTP